MKRPFLVKFPATDWKLYQKRLCHGYLPMTIEKIYSVAFFPEHPRVTAFVLLAKALISKPYLEAGVSKMSVLVNDYGKKN